MKTIISSKGQIVLPAEFRRMDRIEAGQGFDVERLDSGEYRLVRRAVPPNEGAIDWLLAVQSKDSSCPLNPGQRTRCEVPGRRQRPKRIHG